MAAKDSDQRFCLLCHTHEIINLLKQQLHLNFKRMVETFSLSELSHLGEVLVGYGKVEIYSCEIPHPENSSPYI